MFRRFLVNSGPKRFYSSVPQFPPSLLNLKVGKIIECARHENADTLYVSHVQIDEEGSALQICSGLVKYIPRDQLLNQEVVVLTNLKASKMRGVRSEAMLLAAETADTDGDVKVKLVRAPSGSQVGERLYFETFKSDGSPSKLKSSTWQEIQKFLKTDSEGNTIYQHASEDGDEARPCRLQNGAGNTAKSDLNNAIVR